MPGRTAIGGSLVGQNDPDPNGDLFSNARPDPYGNNPGQLDPRGQSTAGGQAATVNPDGSFGQSSAETLAQGYDQKATNAANTPIEGLNYGGAENSLNDAYGNRTNALQSREVQKDALGLAGSAARGQQPSQAELLGQKQTQDALNAQLAAASSANGGPLAVMAAQRQAANNAAGYTQSANQGIAAMRAGEMAHARDQYAGQAGAMRGQDYTGQGLDIGTAQTRAQMEQARGQYAQQQRELNAKREMGYAGMGQTGRENEANRGVALSGQEAGRFANQQQVNQQSKRDSQGFAKDIVNGVGSFISKLAKGGPAEQGQVYLVGEKGPELIIPRHDGEVIPAHTTSALLKHLQKRASGGPIDGAGADSGLGMELQYGSPGQAQQQSETATQFQGHPGAGLSYGGGRASGGPVDGVDDLTSRYFGAPPSEHFQTWGAPPEAPEAPEDPAEREDVERIKSGGIIRKDPYAKDDPWMQMQSMLTDRAAQERPLSNYDVDPGKPSNKPAPWLEAAHAKDNEPTYEYGKGKSEEKRGYEPAGEGLAHGLKLLAREDGGPVKGTKSDKVATSPAASLADMKSEALEKLYGAGGVPPQGHDPAEAKQREAVSEVREGRERASQREAASEIREGRERAAQAAVAPATAPAPAPAPAHEEGPGWRQRWMQTPMHKAIKTMIGVSAFGPVPGIVNAADALVPPDKRNNAFGPMAMVPAAMRAAHERLPEATQSARPRDIKSFERDQPGGEVAALMTRRK